ncbi:MAG: class I SAM-dependent methyltransferase [Gaiellaceae bacterium]
MVKTDWMLDESDFAGAEHRDPVHVTGYDAKTGFEVGPDVELLLRCGLGPTSTLVDLGAGTGTLAAAVASHCRRVVAVDPSPAMLAAAKAKGIECVEAGFLTYEHKGDSPDIVYSRNALHHLPDFWKAIALRRMVRLLAPGGTLVLRDIVYSCEPEELDEVFEAWFSAAPNDPAEGWTRPELEAHVRTEHSTFTWLFEPMLAHAGLQIDDTWYADSRTYARYVCTRS